ncbi:MAG: ParB/RepB/Spo0J family partition protein [Bacteroidales bacterium]|nr:ParB/RepB/Spo0J family partition protein [Bacteroidales bacterium]
MSELYGKKKALGRGLSALLENNETDTNAGQISSEFRTGSISSIRISQIQPNPFQPRAHFNETELAELAISIQQHGIIQPLTIRKIEHDQYQLISGERRLKACIIAGLSEVPAYVRIANDEQMLEMALVENIQRQDLNPLEIAISFQRLLEECKIKQEELSQKVGKDRSTISNYIRLLKLPMEIQVAIRDQLITMGHARAIINLPDEKTQLFILQSILEKKLSVRQVEEAARQIIQGKKSWNLNPPTALSPKAEKFQAALNARFHSKVHLKVSPTGSGTITIIFKSEDELDRIISKFDS